MSPGPPEAGSALDRVAGFFSRVLRWAGDDAGQTGRLEPLRIYLMIHAPFELLWDCLIWENQRASIAAALALSLLLCLAWSLMPGRRTLAMRCFVAIDAAAVVWLFPAVSNHFFLVFSCLLLLSLADLERPPEALLGLQACRWLTLVVLFYSGLQKVLYGTYFKAELLTWTIAHDPRFYSVFNSVLPARESARIAALADTAGPFGSEWWPLLAISNFTYLFELAAPFLLLHPATRSAAVAATVGFLFLIETGAKEYFFGCLFVNLIFLLTRRNWYHVTLPLTALVYLWRLWPRLGRIWEWMGA